MVESNRPYGAHPGIPVDRDNTLIAPQIGEQLGIKITFGLGNEDGEVLMYIDGGMNTYEKAICFWTAVNAKLSLTSIGEQIRAARQIGPFSPEEQQEIDRLAAQYIKIRNIPSVDSVNFSAAFCREAAADEVALQRLR